MKTRRAPARISALSVTGVSAVLLLGAWYGPAFASTDVQAPSPELTAHTESSLHEMLDGDDISSSTIRTIDSSTKQDDESKTDDIAVLNLEMPDIATRLPGVSVSELPRLRRHMYRTDI